MATVKCNACQTNPSITFCNETGVALCGDCAIPCDRCHVALARTKVQVTSTGRKLCPKCMAERNAKRQAKRQRIKEKSRERKRSEYDEVAPTGIEAPVANRTVTPGAMGLSTPAQGSSAPAASPISFEALNDSQGPQTAPPAAEAAKDDFGSESGADFGAPAPPEKDTGPKRNFGLEGVPTDQSSRLELPPVDENRPVMIRSGYRGPTKTAYFFAFLFFGFAGLVFYSTTPILRDIMFPFDTTEYKYNSNQMTPIMDTNRLRDTSNISQFEILAQAPTFFVTWLIIVVYIGGSALIIISTVRSAISSFRARRHQRKVEKKHKGDPFSSLSGH